MTLKAFWRELEKQWAELTDGLWDIDPAAELNVKMERVQALVPVRYERLARLRAFIERLRDRLAEKEKRLAILSDKVSIYLNVADRANSWKHALELDNARRSIERDTTALREFERKYHEQVADLERLKRRLRQLQEKASVLARRD